MENQIHARDELITLIQSLTGQTNVLTVPRELSRFLGDDLPAALLLSQLIYWQGKQGRADGAIYKTYAEWYEEIGLTEYQVRRATKKMSEFLRTKIHRANGSPTVHYYLNVGQFSESILKFLKEPNRSFSRNHTEVSRDSLTETTPETTSEITTGIEEEEEDNHSPSVADIITFFQEEMKIDRINPAMERALGDLVENFPPDRVRAAISAAALYKIDSPLPYLRTVLEKGKEKEESAAEKKEKPSTPADGKSAFSHAPFAFFTPKEVLDLVERFGKRGAEARIDWLSLYKGSTGKKYESDYFTILRFNRQGNPDGTEWAPPEPDWVIRQEWLDSLKPAPAAPETEYREWDPKRHSRVSGNFVICGYTFGTHSSFGSLIVGLPLDGNGRYKCCGLVGRGLTKTGLREELYSLVKDIKTENSPFPRDEVSFFMQRHSNLYGGAISWVRPLRVIGVESKFTNRCQVYEGSFKGLREELKPEDLRGELERLQRG